MEQLHLSFPCDPDSIRSYFEAKLKKPVLLIVTENSSVMMSSQAKGRSVSLRLHRIFLSAPMQVIDEIAEYLRGKKTRTPTLRTYIRNHSYSLKKKPPKRMKTSTRGKYFDLIEFFDAINREYFEGRINSLITWGTRSPRYAVRKRTLGSYSSHSNTIRINPILDSRNVPRYFLEYIVYHEMLHADIGIENNGSRRIVHSREFRHREKLFKHYARAIAWEKKRW
ncbi:MAG: SprT-like domain-containing protein [bacterium]